MRRNATQHGAIHALASRHSVFVQVAGAVCTGDGQGVTLGRRRSHETRDELSIFALRVRVVWLGYNSRPPPQ